MTKYKTQNEPNIFYEHYLCVKHSEPPLSISYFQESKNIINSRIAEFNFDRFD